MSEPTFTRDGTSSLYWADPSDPTAAFLATDPHTLGATPTLTATWADAGGAYVYAGTPAGATFLADLTTWIGEHRPLGPPRFLWVVDPTAPVTEWVVTELPVTGGVVGGTMFQFADYALGVTGGSSIAPHEAAEGGWGFVLADTAAPGLSLSSPVATLTSKPGTGLLSMAAGTAGAWRFVIDAPLPADPGDDVFLQLGAGVRYFTPGQGGLVNPVHFTALSQPEQGGLLLYATIDPLRLLDDERTTIAFHSWAGAGTPPPLPSGYATAYGHRITLQPQADARLVLGSAPSFTDSDDLGFYFVPAGAFAVDRAAADAATTAITDGIDRVLCGTSGLEYLGIPESGGCALTFVPGQPAYAVLGTATDGDQALTGKGTTAWVSVVSPPTATVHYFSQPEDAPLFSAQPAAADVADGALDLLGFLELSAATVPSASALDGIEVGVTAFPMAPFLGLSVGTVDDAVRIEQLALAPERRSKLVPVARPSGGAADTETVGVTPQGLAVGVAADDAWTWLGIGHDGAPSQRPDLRFTAVDASFRTAMQTNNLFLVLGDAAEFEKHGSVAYLLTGHALDVIGTLPNTPIPGTMLDAVRGAMAGHPYDTRVLFCDALKEVAKGITPDQEAIFLRYAGQLTPVVGGWPFRLSPDNWAQTAPQLPVPNTYLIMKFVLGRSITELVGDLSTWAWPQCASPEGPSAAQTEIGEIIAAARAAVQATPTSPYANFLSVVDEPNWTGVLALNVEVPLEQLPTELQVLAAGIDRTRFGAHHFGMSATPYRVVGQSIQYERSSMFGLIDYVNPEDQYFDREVAFAFRVLQLTVGIRNSVVTTFTSRAELLINRLFGAAARLWPTEHGNNVILDGAHQQQQLGGSTQDTYVFSMSGHNVFALEQGMLQSVELLAMQLVTAKGTDPAKGSATVDAVFQLSGNLRFVDPEGFDPFCWGPRATPPGGTPAEVEKDSSLRFGNLAIGMSFELGDPEHTTVFSLQDGNLSFDQANSSARRDSLVSRFPIRLSGLVASPDPLLSPTAAPHGPAELGYVSVTAPMQQSKLTQPWYGLDYTIDLGSLGALAGSEALAMHVLVAWSPGGDDSGDDDGGDGGDDDDNGPGLYLGVRLPGAKGRVGLTLPFQGIVTMGFKGIELLTAFDPTVPDARRTYTLRLRDFALRLLGFAFPPGHNDVILFGNPDQSGSSKVGWYLAYASDADPRRPPAPPTRTEVVRRRATLRTGG